MTSTQALRMALRCMAQWSHEMRQRWFQGSDAVYYCDKGVWYAYNKSGYQAVTELIGSGLDLKSRRIIANAARRLREKGQMK